MALLAERLRRHRLVQGTFTTPEEAVRHLGAVQAQDYYGASWALGLRVRGLRAVDVDAAFNAGRLLRTHVLRPTWHFVTPDDIGWLLALTGPRVQRLNTAAARRLDIDDKRFTRARAVLTETLAAGRTMTRAELAGAFRRARLLPGRGGAATANGSPGTRETQVMVHLLMHAELAGVICSGPRRGKQFTYALLQDRAPQAPAALAAGDRERERWLAELAARYFESHGPATPHDFAWWSGLTVTDCRRGIAAAGIASLVLPEPAGRDRAAGVHLLLPNYDEYVVAYRHRDALIDAAHARNLGQLSSVAYPNYVVHDGRLAGTWQRDLKARSVTIRARLHAPALTAVARKALTAAATRYATFFGLDSATLEVEPAPV